MVDTFPIRILSEFVVADNLKNHLRYSANIFKTFEENRDTTQKSKYAFTIVDWVVEDWTIDPDDLGSNPDQANE